MATSRGRDDLLFGGGLLLHTLQEKLFPQNVIFAFLSQIPFDLAFTVGGIIRFNGFNMMFTFCLCLGLLSVLDSQINIVLKVIAVALGIYISTFCDWPVYAPVFTLLFVWSRNSAPCTKIAMALCLLRVAFPG